MRRYVNAKFGTKMLFGTLTLTAMGMAVVAQTLQHTRAVDEILRSSAHIRYAYQVCEADRIVHWGLNRWPGLDWSNRLRYSRDLTQVTHKVSRLN